MSAFGIAQPIVSMSEAQAYVRITSVSVKARGLADDDAEPIEVIATGEAMKPPCPTDLSAELPDGGGLSLSWVRGTRLGWPLGESVERYVIVIQSETNRLSYTTSEPRIEISGEAIGGMVGTVVISVAQIGDFAQSRPAQISVVL